jgi:uncharacterized membrane protein YeaQ/YmgE (transglycosylase-associated protein family)
MSTSIAINQVPASFSEVFVPVELSQAKPRRSAYLIATWIVVALGVVAIFEPSPSDVGIALLVPLGSVYGNLRWDQRLTLPCLILALFVLTNLISLCYAVDPAQGALYLGITVFMIVVWLFTVGLITRYEEPGLRALLSAMTIGGVLSAALSILCYFDVVTISSEVLFFDRIKGFFKDPNVFGPYLVIILVYTLHRVGSDTGFARRLFWLGSTFCCSLGVLLSYSRAAWVNCVLTLVTFFTLSLTAKPTDQGRRRNLVCLIVVSALVAGAIAYTLTLSQVREVAVYRSGLQDYDAGRFASHNAALLLGLENPLGVGPGQSVIYLDYATHNLFLRVFSENGGLGLLSLVAFILVTLVRAGVLSQRVMNHFQRSVFALVAAGLCGSLVNSMAIDTLHWRHLWLLLAIGWMPIIHEVSGKQAWRVLRKVQSQESQPC